MLIISNELNSQHNEAKLGLTNQFNEKLEDILNKNQSVDRYWILGKVKFPPELGGMVGKIFLEACLEKPPVVKESFLYEVDNRKGTKTLLWVMHPNDVLSIPPLKKTISVGKSPKKRAQKSLGRR